MITSDSHMHTIFSEDCDTPVRSMVESAMQKGLSSICITDHDDYGYEDEEIGALKDPEGYVRTVLDLREEFRDQINIRLGIELGVQPHLGDHFQEITQKYPFDFVIASAHIIDGFDPYLGELYDSMTDEEVIKHTFRYIAKCMKEIPDFDVIGHMDYVVRYAPHGIEQYSCNKMLDEIDEVLKSVIHMGKGIEINTSGMKYLGFCHPHIDILKRYRELGGEIITIGSDAHNPEKIASDFKAAEEILTACGYDFYAEFHKRKPIFKKLY